MISQVAPRHPSQFTAAVSFHVLMDHVAVACANGPLSMRGFDAVRDGSAGIPTASAICQRLGRSWPEVVTIASTPAHRRTYVLGIHAAEGKASRGGVGAAAPDILPSIALEHGEPLTALRYDQIRSESRRGDLPSSWAIIHAFGTWSAALVAGGLTPVRITPPPTPSPPPVVDSLDACIDAIGVLPSGEYFQHWCAALDIPQNPSRYRWKAVVAAKNALPACACTPSSTCVQAGQLCRSTTWSAGPRAPPWSVPRPSPGTGASRTSAGRRG